MGFVKSFEEVCENLVELGLILGRPKAIWVLSGDDDNVSTAISILVAEVLTFTITTTIEPLQIEKGQGYKHLTTPMSF